MCTRISLEQFILLYRKYKNLSESNLFFYEYMYKNLSESNFFFNEYKNLSEKANSFFCDYTNLAESKYFPLTEISSHLKETNTFRS